MIGLHVPLRVAGLVLTNEFLTEGWNGAYNPDTGARR